MTSTTIEGEPRVIRSVRGFFTALARLVRPVVGFLGRVLARAFAPITGAGWMVLLVAAVAIALSVIFGWQEFSFLGAVLFAAMLVSVPFLFGRASYGVLIELNPHRVVVGDRAMGRMLVTNIGRRNLSPSRMELPVGKGLAEFQLPSMKAKDEHEELFAIPTHRRAVIVAGPAVSVRGDQLGLLRRAIRWAHPVDLFVHPLTVRLMPTAAGLVKDLEGQVSKKITSSDIAFHALRPYVPGDDRRYVHWRTSARVGQLMVRQFQETRRSQLTMIHSTMSSLYASDDEFELAISVTTSFGSQVILDGTQMNVVSERGVWKSHSVTALLDFSCRLEPLGAVFESVRSFARETTKRLPAPSVVMIVSGSRTTTSDFRSIETLFGKDTSLVAVKVEIGAAPRISSVSGLSMITVGALDDLPSLVRGLA